MGGNERRGKLHSWPSLHKLMYNFKIPTMSCRDLNNLVCGWGNPQLSSMTQSIVLRCFGYMSDVGGWKFLRSAECLCSHSNFNVGCYVNIVIELCELLSVISSILSNCLTLPCISLDMCPGPKVRSTLNISAVWWLKIHVRKLRRSSCLAGSTISWLSSQERAAFLPTSRYHQTRWTGSTSVPLL